MGKFWFFRGLGRFRSCDLPCISGCRRIGVSNQQDALALTVPAWALPFLCALGGLYQQP